MTKAYIIIRGSGAYSDRSTTPVRVYLDKQKAQETMAKLKAIESWHSTKDSSHYMNYELAQKKNPAVTAEYLAIGFEATVWDDWELAEADLDVES